MEHVTHDPIQLSALIDAVAGPERGGIATFLGTVRRGVEDGPVTRIEYTAYDEMLEAEFGRIVAETADRWPAARVTAQHRLGMVPTGEASIAVVAAAPHRADAFSACRHVVEQAKARLPVWKREFLADGSVRWCDNTGARTPAVPRTTD